MTKKIKIECVTRNRMYIDELKTFQGDLKEISDTEMQKLKKSILKYGFSFPILVWEDKILDGHQRLEAVRQLIFEGYILQDSKLPIVEISASNEREAAEKLLLINSRYAQMTQAGFDGFISNFELELDELGPILSIPDIDFTLPDFEPGSIDDQGKLDELQPKIITCPHCGKDFDSREQG